MDVLEAIFGRRSIRKFKRDPIPYRVLFDIFEAAVSAPRSGNIPSTWMILIESDNIKEKLKNACVDQDWITQAPVIVAVCSDKKRLKQVYGERSELYSIQNSSAVIQNMLIAAREYDIHSTWIGAFSESDVRTVLSIPKKINVHALIALGKSDETPKKIPTVQATDLVYYEKWKVTDKASKLIPLSESPKLQKTIQRAKKSSQKARDKFIKRFGKTIKHFK